MLALVPMAVAVMMICSFFLGFAVGCVFAVVPLIKRRLIGPFAGMVGAYGNFDAILLLTIFSLVLLAMFCAVLLDKPKVQWLSCCRMAAYN